VVFLLVPDSRLRSARFAGNLRKGRCAHLRFLGRCSQGGLSERFRQFGGAPVLANISPEASFQVGFRALHAEFASPRLAELNSSKVLGARNLFRRTVDSRWPLRNKFRAPICPAAYLCKVRKLPESCILSRWPAGRLGYR